MNSNILPQQTVTVLNTPCVLTHRDLLADSITSLCKSPAGQMPLSVDFTNVHITAMRAVHPDFYKTTSSVDFFVSDSQVLTWAMSFLGAKNHSRIYGPDFMNYLFQRKDSAIRHYFLGASESCLQSLKQKIAAIHPEYNLVGSHNGYFTPDEEPQIVDDINRCKPDILWVGLGTPKQQQWIDRNKSLLQCKAILAVGFAFDVNAGTKKDAPRFLGPLGLTWLYRFACEPRRLWKRYLVYNSIFLFYLFCQRISGKPSAAL
jgi:N-acetylglucosaminyldiphosphoundecaprenol N-acetyl-beta-D-mannosaminyltransferase